MKMPSKRMWMIVIGFMVIAIAVMEFFNWLFTQDGWIE